MVHLFSGHYTRWFSVHMGHAKCIRRVTKLVGGSLNVALALLLLLDGDAHSTLLGPPSPFYPPCCKLWRNGWPAAMRSNFRRSNCSAEPLSLPTSRPSPQRSVRNPVAHSAYLAPTSWVGSSNLCPNQRIVQAWREISWEPGIYSIVRFEPAEQGSGTRLDFDHTGFPAGAGEHLAVGWKSHYWDPLENFLR